MAPQGTHRIKNTPPLEDGVFVTDGAMGFEVPESTYREKGYTPPLELRPWHTSAPGGDAA